MVCLVVCVKDDIYMCCYFMCVKRDICRVEVGLKVMVMCSVVVVC